MSNIKHAQLSDEQKQKVVARAQRAHQKRRAKLQEVVQSQQLYLQNSAGDVVVGAGTCDIFGVLAYQWVDAAMTFSGGSLSFSGNDWSLALIVAEGAGPATLFVPLNQISSTGSVRVVADAEEAGAASLTFFDSDGNVVAELVAVLEGAGISAPLSVSGTYTINAS